MSNIKHSLAATLSVALVCILAAIQASDLPAVGADRLNQANEQAEANVTAEVATEPEAVEPVVNAETEVEDEELVENISEDFRELSPFNPVTSAYIGKEVYVLTDGSSINLRESDSTESESLDALPLGTKLKVEDIKGEWFKVTVGENTGFVKSSYTTLDYEAVKAVLLATTMYQKAVVNAGVNVRSETSEDAVILDSVSENEDVYVLDEIDGWCKVYFGKNYDIGYIKSEYLTIGDMVSRSDVNAKRNKRISSIIKDGKIKTSKKVVDVKIMPDAESETIVTLSNGARCKIVSGGSN